jgi:four helix bundle protein
MPPIRSFEDFEIWQLAREFCREIYEVTLRENFSRDYSLKDQINRSAGSIMDNIAEGYERGGNKEFIQFLSISKASCAEVRSQLYRAFDRNHITKEHFEQLKNKATTLGRKIGALMNYLGNSDMRGSKFHEPHADYIDPDTE